MEIKSTNQRTIILDLIKTKFGAFSKWDVIESDIASLCANIPEATNEKQKKDLIKQLRKIKDYLLEKDITEKELSFLEEEIERYEKTKQISLYEEEQDDIDLEIIQKYSNLSYGTEGIMGIHLGYNYEQLKKLTNGVYKRTGLIKFYISREKTVYGKIVAEIYDYPQKIPVATLAQSKAVDKETGKPVFKKIFLFGEKINLQKVDKIKEINLPFRVYRFISEFNQDLILLSHQALPIGDYIVTGVVTQLDDFKVLTDSSRLPTKLPYMFAQSIKNRIVRFKNKEEFRKQLGILKVNKINLFNFPFTIEKNKKLYVLKQPKWFKWLMWSWLTHTPIGLFNNYPLHIMVIGPKSSGKSLMLNSFHARSKESRSIFSGSSSTLKHLVPSFKYNPARLGYLAESNRFAYCDEFLRCIINTRTAKEGSHREEGVAIMNDLLEHQKREAGSGVSKINVNMTSRIIATTNPVKEIHNVEDMIKKLDESFLSRWLIYYQGEEHVKLIRGSSDSELKVHDYNMSNNDWIAILDYLHSFKSVYEESRLKEIRAAVIPVLSVNLRGHYDARHGHHIEALMDGIVKTRCLFERDMNFTAKEVDYEVLQLVWSNIIKSWINIDHLRNIPLNQKKHYLPENSHYIYELLCEEKRPMRNYALRDAAIKEMNKHEFRTAYIILRENGLIKESGDEVMPHYFGEKKE